MERAGRRAPAGKRHVDARGGAALLGLARRELVAARGERRLDALLQSG